jgi:hypothetical protein
MEAVESLGSGFSVSEILLPSFYGLLLDLRTVRHAITGFADRIMTGGFFVGIL